jgi:hypothetical protein
MSLRRFAFIGITLIALLLLPLTRARSYVSSGSSWPNGNITMQLQLGPVSSPLIDGASSWGASAESALATWNLYMDRAQFTVVRDSTAPIASGNRINNVFWSSNAYGKPFDDYASPTQGGTIIALTLWFSTGSNRTESDVIFRNTLSWNSYRGALRRTSSGATLFDFHRVALHEFGHVIGLQHPNDFGQNVVAQMNSNTSDLDTLAADDISGARALYFSGFGNGTVVFPPQNETLDFRSQLENEYRSALRRSAIITTFVDTVGDAVWTQEYFRYRVNQCSHAGAVQRVIDEINGLGTGAVCGASPVGQVSFPPRNEALDFRNQLESEYRDGLGRGPSLTAVDNEGDVVWTQEYLRYRVNACSHTTAVAKVMQQIEGLGIQPVCH